MSIVSVHPERLRCQCIDRDVEIRLRQPDVPRTVFKVVFDDVDHRNDPEQIVTLPVVPEADTILGFLEVVLRHLEMGQAHPGLQKPRRVDPRL
jgi:hypothetical protein